MDSIGAEVGQKMRSAIKAKLLELNCYVDDELPDYIMVMVANKRTKSQMNEDLNLFLSTKTSTFVDWLHIVLKKLKEVTVTNPEIYKKVTTKRKSVDVPDTKVKKEKKEMISVKEQKERILNMEMEQSKSLTDNLPVDANRLSEQRKITVVNENTTNNNDVFDIPLLSQVNMSSEKDLQNIEKRIRNVKSRLGLLVDSDVEEELPEIKVEKDNKKKQKNYKNFNYRAAHIQNELENNLSKIDGVDELESKESVPVSTNNTSLEKKTQRKRIIFEDESPPKKPSILERLGSRPIDSLTVNPVRTRISLSEFRKEEESFLKFFSSSKEDEGTRDRRKRNERKLERSRRDNGRTSSPEERRRGNSRDRNRDRSSDRSRFNAKKESILSRLGVMSKVSIPSKEPEEQEVQNELKTREVRSTVQVKPRIIPSGTPQPNKNLLLKAVAEAQRSVAQTPRVGSYEKPNSTNADVEKSSEKHEEEVFPYMRKFSQKEKNKLKNLLLSHATQDKSGYTDCDSNTEEYIPKPIKETPKETPKYIPSCRLPEEAKDDVNVQQQFIVTLDGIEKKLFNSEYRPSVKDRLDIKILPETIPKLPVISRLDSKKSPSPIIFDKTSAKLNTKVDIPDKLPIVHPPLSVKNKERCKYWPNCRQGDKCEFVHPSNPCEKFPHCKFGDKCLYLHPPCKFGSSCTKRDCPYNHGTTAKLMSRAVPKNSIITSGLQTCKFFPNCTNSNCQFYHPKPCKYGKYCKNQSDCNFSHHFTSNKSSLIWRSK